MEGVSDHNAGLMPVEGGEEGGGLSMDNAVPRKVWPGQSSNQSHSLEELLVSPKGPASVAPVCLAIGWGWPW